MAHPLLTLIFASAGTDDFGRGRRGEHSSGRQGNTRIDRSALASEIEISAAASTDVPDAELVTRVRAGDEAAFETIFHAHYQSLVRYAYSLTRRADAADDIVADVFHGVWRMRATWAPRGGIATYFFVAVRNRARNAERSERRWHRLLNAQPSAGGRSADAEAEMALAAEDRASLLDAVRCAIRALPGPRREVMLLRWEHGMGIPTIATVTGLSENAVRLQLSRAMQLLRALVRAGELGGR